MWKISRGKTHKGRDPIHKSNSDVEKKKKSSKGASAKLSIPTMRKGSLDKSESFSDINYLSLSSRVLNRRA